MHLLGRIALLLASLLLVLLVGETALQVAARFATGREDGWRPGAAVRILAVGDSHTYGAGVEPEEAYPAQLQRILDARAPGRYSVVNLGLPGMSTTQVRNRLPLHVARYGPDFVLVLCGINNGWNLSELDRAPSGGLARLDAWAYPSRLYRLVRVWLHDRELERSLAATRVGGVRQAAIPDEAIHRPRESTTWRFEHGGVVETIHNEQDAELRFDEAMQERAYRDYRAMAAWIRPTGVQLVLVQYPQGFGGFVRANRAMQRAAAEARVAIIASPTALARIPKEEVEWLAAAHPNARVYLEMAREIAPVIEVLEE